MSASHGYRTMGGIEYDDGDCVEKKKREKRGHKKRGKGPNKKMREKERRDNVTILLPHLCFKAAP